MDLETENRIAAILLKEAAELRRQAQKEGVNAYLQQPKVRGRPNSRFLTATVLGVQQANRAVEVNEMWQARQKELEMDDRLKGSSVHDSDSGRIRDLGKSSKSPGKKRKIDDNHASTSYGSNRTMLGNSCPEEDEGLRDEEVEDFLQSRVKRGRGAVGSRMDETGPYLPSHPNSNEMTTTGPDAREHRVVFGPEKPSFVKRYESSEEERDQKKARSSKKKHSRKHESKEKSKDKKKKDKRRKH